jgi:hypothetical protein
MGVPCEASFARIVPAASAARSSKARDAKRSRAERSRKAF